MKDTKCECLRNIESLQNTVDRGVRRLANPRVKDKESARKVARLPIQKYRVLRRLGIMDTVDFVLTRTSLVAGGMFEEFMLITRRGSALKNCRWIFGGARRKGEPLMDALKGIFEDETGCRFDDAVLCYDMRPHCQDIAVESCRSPFGLLPAAHMTMHVYLLQVGHTFVPQQDGSYDSARWYPCGPMPQGRLLPDLKLLLIRTGLVKA